MDCSFPEKQEMCIFSCAKLALSLGGWGMIILLFEGFFYFFNEKCNHLSPCGVDTLIPFRNSCPSIDFTVPKQIFW